MKTVTVNPETKFRTSNGWWKHSSLFKWNRPYAIRISKTKKKLLWKVLPKSVEIRGKERI